MCILKQYLLVCSELEDLGAVGLFVLIYMILTLLEISAAENAVSLGDVWCHCIHGTEERPHEIEPFGKVCWLDLIFLLGHSCLGL